MNFKVFSNHATTSSERYPNVREARLSEDNDSKTGELECNFPNEENLSCVLRESKAHETVNAELPQCREGKTRWFFLLIPFFALPSYFFPILRTVYYITPSVAVCSYVILYHCPYFLKSMHTKPLYFEDLEDNEAIRESLKRKFQDVFLKIINVLLAIIVGGLVDYFLYRFQRSSLSWFEILGLIGGMLSLYRTMWDYVGRFLLMVLMLKKEQLRSPSSALLAVRPELDPPALSLNDGYGVNKCSTDDVV